MPKHQNHRRPATDKPVSTEHLLAPTSALHLLTDCTRTLQTSTVLTYSPDLLYDGRGPHGSHGAGGQEGLEGNPLARKTDAHFAQPEGPERHPARSVCQLTPDSVLAWCAARFTLIRPDRRRRGEQPAATGLRAQKRARHSFCVPSSFLFHSTQSPSRSPLPFKSHRSGTVLQASGPRLVDRTLPIPTSPGTSVLCHSLYFSTSL